MPTCAAKDCTTRAADSQISMYRFPLKDEALLRRWIQNINRREYNWSWMPNSSSRLCSKHFSVDCFNKYKPRQRVLLPTAVPTIFGDDEVPEVSMIDAEISDSSNILVTEEPPHNDTTEEIDVAESQEHYHISEARRTMAHDHSSLWMKDSSSTVKCKLNHQIISKSSRRMIRLERQKNRRLERRVSSLSDVIKELKKTLLISSGCAKMLDNSFSGVSKQLLTRVQQRMLFHFCPQCGSKLQTGFRFCPSCGEKLPGPVVSPGPSCPVPMETVSSGVSQLDVTDAATTTANTSPPVSASAQPTVRDAGGLIFSTPSPVSTRLPLRRTRDSDHLRQGTEVPSHVATPRHTSSLKRATDESPRSVVSPRKRLAVTTQVKPIREEEAAGTTVSSPVTRTNTATVSSPVTRTTTATVSSPGARTTTGTVSSPGARTTTGTVSSPIDRTTATPISSPTPRSPATVKGKAKKAKRASTIEHLQEGEELSDTTGRKWWLLKLLGQSEVELIYAVQQSGPGSSSSSYKHILKLGAKDGRIFNEQNFFQRAAKPSSVEKWMKHTKTDFIGLPSCVGFGLHSEAYRFLIFPNMGQTLQSVMEEEELLPEAAVLQLACRILDVLEFIHENEYVHADIQAENIYIHPAENTQYFAKLTRQMVCSTQPSGKASLETVWKRASTFKTTWQVYLAGYCHAFRYCPGGRHVEYREGSRTPHEGALEFISLESHKGAGPSRRSDLQALGYCLLRWHTGVLPWGSLTHTPSRVAAEKQRFMEDVPGLLSHCYGQKTVSKALQSYLSQVMSLQYCEQPDYKALREGLHAALQLLGGSLEQPLSLQKNTTRRR